MACLLNNGLTDETCEYLIGGIKTIYIANKSEVLSFNDSGADNVYDSITMSSTMSYFYQFDVSKNTSSYTSQLQVSGTNKYRLHTLDFFVKASSQEAYDISEALDLGNFVAIVENRMGDKVILGMNNGLEATVGEANSGVAEGDNSGIHFTLTGAERYVLYKYIGTIPTA